MPKDSPKKPRAKPLSLYPLKPEEALRAALTNGKPEKPKRKGK
jgi:hypothetical protein